VILEKFKHETRKKRVCSTKNKVLKDFNCKQLTERTEKDADHQHETLGDPSV
jgi:hypothetical protein